MINNLQINYKIDSFYNYEFSLYFITLFELFCWHKLFNKLKNVIIVSLVEI
jgi:hypothetical protein